MLTIRPIDLYVFLISLPLLACLLNYFLSSTQKLQRLGAKLSAALIGVGFIAVSLSWFLKMPSLSNEPFAGIFVTKLSWVLATLILFISWVVQTFSIRYMDGDRYFSRFFIGLPALTTALLFFVSADHLLALLLSFAASYGLLIKLMIHKPIWRASKQSGLLALKYFGCSFFLMLLGSSLLVHETGCFSLSGIFREAAHISKASLMIALLFFMVGSFILSAIWPFHKWLLSSLNAPTPVSALMHAGLVNGGGVLLVRFAPLYMDQASVMMLIFLCGLATTTIGTFWKLIQSDIKRMLACSTVAQMGFMLMQIGLGLFPAAIAHLCWHGTFKSYLFLRSGASAKEHKHHQTVQKSSAAYIVALTCGLLGSLGFIFACHHQINPLSSVLFIAFIVGMTTMQLALEIVSRKSLVRSFFPAAVASFFIGAFYAKSVGFIEKALMPDISIVPTSIHLGILMAIPVVFLPWMALRLGLIDRLKQKKWWKQLYMLMLNSSQPEEKTLTTNKFEYQY